MENIDNIGEIVKKTDERFDINDKNLEMVILKNKLKIPSNESFPDGLGGFINCYKNDFEEIKKAKIEAEVFISAIKKAEAGDYINLNKEELVTLNLIPEDKLNEFISEFDMLKEVNKRREDKNNVWLQKGLGNMTEEDLAKQINLLKDKFNQEKDSLKVQEEYKKSIVVDYNNRLSLLDSFKLPEGYTTDSLIKMINTAKTEAGIILQKRKVA